MTATPYSVLAVPSTDLGDLLRSRHTPSRARKWLTTGVRGVVVAIIAMVGMLSIGAPTANAWLLDNAVSKIENFCAPNDVTSPSDAFGGIDGAFGLNTFDPDNVDVQKTVLPDSKGKYSKSGETLKVQYQRYGFSALKVHSYGVECGSLIARYAPGLFNIALTIFVYIPTALTMLLVKVALGAPLSSFISSFLSPIFKALCQAMKPIVTVLCPVGVLFAYIKWRGRLSKVLGVAVYSLTCAGFVYWGAGSSTALKSIVKTSNNIVSTTTATITGTMASSAFPQVSATGTDISSGGSTTFKGKPEDEINNALWKGVPLATWTTAQMGSDMASKAANEATANDDPKELNAADWQRRLLNANHIGLSDANNVDEDGLIVLASVDAWNSRSYAFTGSDTKTDFWTEGPDAAVDGQVAAKKSYAWEAIPQLSDVGVICNDHLQHSKGWTGGGNGELENNRWMFNGSCTPSAQNAAWKNYYTGLNWHESYAAIMTGAMGAFIIFMMCGIMAFLVAVQKALMYWLLIFAGVFIGIAAFGDEKRRKFAKAYFEEFATCIFRQVMWVAALVLLSYMIAAIIVSSDVAFFLKPLLIFILGSSLWLLGLIAHKLLKAAVSGDTSVVHKTAHAPGTAAKAAVVTGATVATAGAGLAALGAVSTGATGFQAVGAGANVARGFVAAQGGVSSAARRGAKAVLTNPHARNRLASMLGHGTAGKTARTVFAASDLVGAARSGTSSMGKKERARMAYDPIAQGFAFFDGDKSSSTRWGEPAGTGRRRPGPPPPPSGAGSPGGQGSSTNLSAPPNGSGGGRHAAPHGGVGDPRTWSASQRVAPLGTSPTGGLGRALSQAPTMDPKAAAASAQVVSTPPPGGAPIGTSVTPSAVQTPVNQTETGQAVASAVQTKAQVLAAEQDIPYDQAVAQVQSRWDSASSTMLTGVPTTAEMNPSNISPELASVATQIAGDDATALPAAVATATLADQGRSHVDDLMSTATSFSGALQTQVVGTVREGTDLETLVGMTRDEAATDPEQFVKTAFSRQIYGDSGSMVNIDPRHPATEPLMTAIGALGAGNDDGYNNALAELSSKVKVYGIPSVATGLHAVDGSDLADSAADTMLQAGAMAATYQPGDPSEWSDYAQNIKLMQSTLSEEMLTSTAGMQLTNLSNIVCNPNSTVDDIRVAGAALVSAINMDTTDTDLYVSTGVMNEVEARESDRFSSTSYAQSFFGTNKASEVKRDSNGEN